MAGERVMRSGEYATYRRRAVLPEGRVSKLCSGDDDSIARNQRECLAAQIFTLTNCALFSVK